MAVNAKHPDFSGVAVLHEHGQPAAVVGVAMGQNREVDGRRLQGERRPVRFARTRALVDAAVREDAVFGTVVVFDDEEVGGTGKVHRAVDGAPRSPIGGDGLAVFLSVQFLSCVCHKGLL